MTAMFEIIKMASRFTDAPPEVIAYADSFSEAQALANDYQVNFYGTSAYVTFRRAGDSTPTGKSRKERTAPYRFRLFS
jgi:hypothetical protein